MTVLKRQQQNKDNNHQPRKKGTKKWDKIQNTRQPIHFLLRIQHWTCCASRRMWYFRTHLGYFPYDKCTFLLSHFALLSYIDRYLRFICWHALWTWFVSHKWMERRQEREKLKFKVYYRIVGTINEGKKRYINGWGKMTRRRRRRKSF